MGGGYRGWSIGADIEAALKVFIAPAAVGAN